MDIPDIIESSLNKHHNIDDFTLEDVIEAIQPPGRKFDNINSHLILILTLQLLKLKFLYIKWSYLTQYFISLLL